MSSEVRTSAGREARTEVILATARMPWEKHRPQQQLRFKEREVNNRRDPSDTKNASNSTDLSHICYSRINKSSSRGNTGSNISRGVSNYRDVSSSKASNFAIPDAINIVFLF